MQHTVTKDDLIKFPCGKKSILVQLNGSGNGIIIFGGCSSDEGLFVRAMDEDELEITVRGE